jgi:hypothetical protein
VVTLTLCAPSGAITLSRFSRIICRHQQRNVWFIKLIVSCIISSVDVGLWFFTSGLCLSAAWWFTSSRSPEFTLSTAKITAR